MNTIVLGCLAFFAHSEESVQSGAQGLCPHGFEEEATDFIPHVAEKGNISIKECANKCDDSRCILFHYGTDVSHSTKLTIAGGEKDTWCLIRYGYNKYKIHEEVELPPHFTVEARCRRIGCSTREKKDCEDTVGCTWSDTDKCAAATCEGNATCPPGTKCDDESKQCMAVSTEDYTHLLWGFADASYEDLETTNTQKKFIPLTGAVKDKFERVCHSDTTERFRFKEFKGEIGTEVHLYKSNEDGSAYEPRWQNGRCGINKMYRTTLAGMDSYNLEECFKKCKEASGFTYTACEFNIVGENTPHVNYNCGYYKVPKEGSIEDYGSDPIPPISSKCETNTLNQESDKINKLAVFAFRGTELGTRKDAREDLIAKDFNNLGLFKKWYAYWDDAKRMGTDEMGEYKYDEHINGSNRDRPAVYRGFALGFSAIRAWFEEEVKKLVGEGYEIMITGHSLGGAISYLAALHAAEMTPPPKKIRVITFGSPKVGTESWRKLYKEKLGGCGHTIGYASVRDLVTRVPFPGNLGPYDTPCPTRIQRTKRCTNNCRIRIFKRCMCRLAKKAKAMSSIHHKGDYYIDTVRDTFAQLAAAPTRAENVDDVKVDADILQCDSGKGEPDNYIDTEQENFDFDAAGGGDAREQHREMCPKPTTATDKSAIGNVNGISDTPSSPNNSDDGSDDGISGYSSDDVSREVSPDKDGSEVGSSGYGSDDVSREVSPDKANGRSADDEWCNALLSGLENDSSSTVSSDGVVPNSTMKEQGIKTHTHDNPLI